MPGGQNGAQPKCELVCSFQLHKFDRRKQIQYQPQRKFERAVELYFDGVVAFVGEQIDEYQRQRKLERAVQLHLIDVAGRQQNHQSRGVERIGDAEYPNTEQADAERVDKCAGKLHKGGSGDEVSAVFSLEVDHPNANASTNALANYVKAAAAALKTSSPSNSSSATPNASTNALSNYLKQGESSQRASINASTSALANYTESVARSAAKQAKDTPEQLGPGWSRDQNGKLRYESDLISQLLVPGRGPADQVATHLANGDYWQVAIAGVAWLAEDLLFVASLGGSQARTAGTRIAAEGVKKATQAAATATPKGQVYSVAAEVKLSPTSYPGVSRRAHIQEANEHLLGSMEADPSLAQRMGGMGIKIDRTVTGRSPSSPPSDWTWHHAPEPGIVQLVPREQHASGSIFQRTLHPGGIGGYAIWGRK